MAAQLSVRVYDKGVLQASVTENDDMVMNNFMNFLQSWLSYEGASSASSTFTMTDTSGSAPTRSRTAPSSVYKPDDSAFTGGRSSVTAATRFAISTST